VSTASPRTGVDASSLIFKRANNSGQATLRRRFSKQLSVRAICTFAKSIDETSNTGGTIAYNFSQAQDSRNLKLERGRSDFDIGHSFACSFIRTPQLSQHWLARDWQMAGTSTIYTGSPFTPRVANYSYGNGEASRPDRVRKGTVEILLRTSGSTAPPSRSSLPVLTGSAPQGATYWTARAPS